MAENKTVQLPDDLIAGAVKDQFVVGQTITLSDGREIEVRAGKPKFKHAIAIGRALGADADPVEVNLMLACRWVRLKGGGLLTPDDIGELEIEDANLLMEAALPQSFLSQAQVSSPRSSATGSARNISKK